MIDPPAPIGLPSAMNSTELPTVMFRPACRSIDPASEESAPDKFTKMSPVNVMSRSASMPTWPPDVSRPPRKSRLASIVTSRASIERSASPKVSAPTIAFVTCTSSTASSVMSPASLSRMPVVSIFFETTIDPLESISTSAPFARIGMSIVSRPFAPAASVVSSTLWKPGPTVMPCDRRCSIIGPLTACSSTLPSSLVARNSPNEVRLPAMTEMVPPPLFACTTEPSAKVASPVEASRSIVPRSDWNRPLPPTIRSPGVTTMMLPFGIGEVMSDDAISGICTLTSPALVSTSITPPEPAA